MARPLRQPTVLNSQVDHTICGNIVFFGARAFFGLYAGAGITELFHSLGLVYFDCF